jgi:hypothetical protein
MESENMKVESMKVEAEMEESPVAYVDIIYHKLLGDVTSIDEEEYTLYANMNAKRIAKRVAVWRRGHYDMMLQVSPPRFYIHEEWHGPSAWEEETVYRLILLPPRYPPPNSRWFDARKLGINARCVYLQDVMGKVEVDEVDKIPKRGRKIAAWFDEYSYGGKFENVLKRVGNGRVFVLTRTWVPRFGYSGSAKQIYLITLQDHDESED